jgi:hypothetical protein
MGLSSELLSHLEGLAIGAVEVLQLVNIEVFERLDAHGKILPECVFV